MTRIIIDKLLKHMKMVELLSVYIFENVRKRQSTFNVQHFKRNQAQFDLLCFRGFGNRFGCAEGATPYKTEFIMFAPFFAPF